ncbi:MAG TPA: Zn-ribbon domain-containing OB-fold protein [Nitrososphaerales archaeon]|nr:Zn-ribbon domain-containing OB-fold protein [Nitrososphaerales archaeon]
MTEQFQTQKQSSLTVKEFQEGIREGKIEGYKCSKCGHKQIDIIEFCPVCHSPDLEKVEFSGKGSVVTYTIQLVAPEQFMNEVPYAWAVINLDDGPRVTGWIPFISKPSDLPVGQRVEFKKSYLPGTVFEKI